MGSHPAATEKTLQYVEAIINGAAPVSDTDVLRVFEKAKVFYYFFEFKLLFCTACD